MYLLPHFLRQHPVLWSPGQFWWNSLIIIRNYKLQIIVYSHFKNSLIIHKHISLSEMSNWSRAWTFIPGKNENDYHDLYIKITRNLYIKISVWSLYKDLNPIVLNARVFSGFRSRRRIRMHVFSRVFETIEKFAGRCYRGFLKLFKTLAARVLSGFLNPIKHCCSCFKQYIKLFEGTTAGHILRTR